MSDVHIPIIELIEELEEREEKVDIELHRFVINDEEMAETDALRPHQVEDNLILAVDNRFDLVLHSPISGYVHLFNLGTSGICTKLIPSEFVPDNRINGGETFYLPERAQLIGGFTVCPPLTSITGQPERFLAVVTKESFALEVNDLAWGQLSSQDAVVHPDNTYPLLTLLDEAKAIYGLIEYTVIEQ